MQIGAGAGAKGGAGAIGAGSRTKRTSNSNSPPLKTPTFQFLGNLDKLCKFMQIYAN